MSDHCRKKAMCENTAVLKQNLIIKVNFIVAFLHCGAVKPNMHITHTAYLLKKPMGTQKFKFNFSNTGCADNSKRKALIARI